MEDIMDGKRREDMLYGYDEKEGGPFKSLSTCFLNDGEDYFCESNDEFDGTNEE